MAASKPWFEPCLTDFSFSPYEILLFLSHVKIVFHSSLVVLAIGTTLSLSSHTDNKRGITSFVQNHHLPHSPFFEAYHHVAAKCKTTVPNIHIVTTTKMSPQIKNRDAQNDPISNPPSKPILAGQSFINDGINRVLCGKISCMTSIRQQGEYF